MNTARASSAWKWPLCVPIRGPEPVVLSLFAGDSAAILRRVRNIQDVDWFEQLDLRSAQA